MLRDRLRIGVGVDDEHAYIVEAHRRAGAHRLHFLTGDATRLPIRAARGCAGNRCARAA